MVSQTDAERYARAKEVFFAALDLYPRARAEFVRTACGDDAALLREVESLLKLRAEAGDFLELPAIGKVSVHEHSLDYFKDKVIGGYRLVRELGAGGMGVVFLAEKDDGEFSRQVALKIVKSDLHISAIHRRFNLERQILNRLEHPNIAHLIDGGTTTDGLPYFVMEYVEGVPLVEYAKKNNLSLGERLELFRQVCAAVSFAHKHAVIHRDLKPSNILVTADGTVKLLDFGIAKLLSSETLTQPESAQTLRAMTPEYASPEQIKGEIVTTVSDVYSLGVVLYELLTELCPYETDSGNLNDIIHRVCEVDPARPSSIASHRVSEGNQAPLSQRSDLARVRRSLKGDLDNIILKALRKEPERRYSSVDDFREDVQRHLKGLPVLARRGTFAYRAEKFIGRNRIAVALTLLIVLAVLGGIATTVSEARRAERERARAERRFNEVRTLADSFLFELNDEILKGQTQGRALVVRRALEYLNRLASEASDDASLQREVAVAYLKIGDIQGKPYSPNLGDTEGAFESYDKARTILEMLHRADQTNRAIQLSLSTAYVAIGSIQTLRRAIGNEAAESLQKARQLGEELVAADPTNEEYRRMLADTYKSVGDLPNDADQRTAWHRKALALRKELAGADPTNTQEQAAVASLHQRIGQQLLNRPNASLKADDYRAALENFDKALEIYRGLQAAEPANSRHRRNVADMTAARIRALVSLGNKSEAMKDYKVAMEIFEELATADPKNAEARLDIAYTQQIMCESFLKLNDTASALKSCRKGLSIADSLLASDPTDMEVRYYVYRNYRSIIDALKKEGNINGAIQTGQQALVIFEQWLAIEPQNAIYLPYVANISSEIGEMYAAIASKTRTPTPKKKQNWLIARDWLTRSLDAWHDLQKQNAVPVTKPDIVNKVELEIARCDAALGQRK
jgi:tetratricopeptide (TPR) repeat protein/tRNA A-37 threonylcarbamoyl transferase component Bud32